LWFWEGQRPLVPLLSLALHFYSIRVHHLVSLDDQHLLAYAMASDFSVAWQSVSQSEQLFFVTDQTPRSLPARFEKKLLEDVVGMT
jgi:hypothetical protein